jgi:hypothetical protein
MVQHKDLGIMYVPPFRPVHRPLPPPVHHHHHLPQQLPLPANYQLSPEQIMHGLEVEGHRLAEQLRMAKEMERGESPADDFLPGLASSLHSLAWNHHRVKQDEEALAVVDQAIAVHRDLALAGSQEQAEKLYLALYNSLVLRAIILTALGRNAEAKAARAEAKKAWHVSLDARTDGPIPHFTRKLSRKILRT